jgi:hypothetical protein
MDLSYGKVADGATTMSRTYVASGINGNIQPPGSTPFMGDYIGIDSLANGAARSFSVLLSGSNVAQSSTRCVASRCDKRLAHELKERGGGIHDQWRCVQGPRRRPVPRPRRSLSSSSATGGGRGYGQEV